MTVYSILQIGEKMNCSLIFLHFVIFYMHLFVVVAVVKFPVLHPAFQLFPSCCFQYFSQRISKINNPYFLSFGRSNHIFMLRTVITDISFNSQALIFKVDVLPCKTTGFPDTKSCIVCNLDWQNRRWIFLFQILDKPFIILMRNRLCAFFDFIIGKRPLYFLFFQLRYFELSKQSSHGQYSALVYKQSLLYGLQLKKRQIQIPPWYLQ